MGTGGKVHVFFQHFAQRGGCRCGVAEAKIAQSFQKYAMQAVSFVEVVFENEQVGQGNGEVFDAYFIFCVPVAVADQFPEDGFRIVFPAQRGQARPW